MLIPPSPLFWTRRLSSFVLEVFVTLPVFVIVIPPTVLSIVSLPELPVFETIPDIKAPPCPELVICVLPCEFVILPEISKAPAVLPTIVLPSRLVTVPEISAPPSPLFEINRLSSLVLESLETVPDTVTLPLVLLLLIVSLALSPLFVTVPEINAPSEPLLVI